MVVGFLLVMSVYDSTSGVDVLVYAYIEQKRWRKQQNMTVIATSET